MNFSSNNLSIRSLSLSIACRSLFLSLSSRTSFVISSVVDTSYAASQTEVPLFKVSNGVKKNGSIGPTVIDAREEVHMVTDLLVLRLQITCLVALVRCCFPSVCSLSSRSSLLSNAQLPIGLTRLKVKMSSIFNEQQNRRTHGTIEQTSTRFIEKRSNLLLD